MLAPSYHPSILHTVYNCSPFCKFIFYSNIRWGLFNATKRLVETCRSELHTLNPECIFVVPKIETCKVWFQVRFRAEDPNLAHPFAVGSTGHSFGGCRFKQLVGFEWCLHHKRNNNILTYPFIFMTSPCLCFAGFASGLASSAGFRGAPPGRLSRRRCSVSSGSGETWLGVGFSDRPTRLVSNWNLGSFKFTYIYIYTVPYILMVSLLLISCHGLSLVVWLTNNRWGYDKSSGFNRKICNRQR